MGETIKVESAVEGVVAILDGMLEQNDDARLPACIAALEWALEILRGVNGLV